MQRLKSAGLGSLDLVLHVSHIPTTQSNHDVYSYSAVPVRICTVERLSLVIDPLTCALPRIPNSVPQAPLNTAIRRLSYLTSDDTATTALLRMLPLRFGTSWSMIWRLLTCHYTVSIAASAYFTSEARAIARR